MRQQANHIIISQIKNIGDVVLCLPMIGLLKQFYPQCKITLLARSYTKSIADACGNIDNFMDWEQISLLDDSEALSEFKKLQADTIIHVSTDKHIAKLAKNAGIKTRIGTIQRLYHWLYCNKMVNQARRNSVLHEVQLNIRLLKPLGIINNAGPQQLIPYIDLHLTGNLPTQFSDLISEKKFNLILHPGSHGHGREWPLTHFQQLVTQLPRDKFNIFLTGTVPEQQRFQPLLDSCPQINNLIGQLSLPQLILFIKQADGLIASGTGPLHLAAALNIKALGLFPPRKGIGPRRWAPVGYQAKALVHQRPANKPCFGCRNSVGCKCMALISVDEVLKIMLNWQNELVD